MKKHKANTTSHFTYEIKRPYEPLWKTTWSGSSLAHLTRRLRKRASRISEGAGAVGEKTPRPRISFLLLFPTQAFYFISKSHKTNCKGLKKNPQQARYRKCIYLQPWAPRTLPWTWGASHAVEASVAGRRALLVSPEHLWLPTAGLQEGEREAGYSDNCVFSVD